MVPIDGTPRSDGHPKVCGVSSDLRNLKLSESGGSRNPRNDVSPAPPPPTTSESDAMVVESEAKRKREREELLAKLIERFAKAERLDLDLPEPEDPFERVRKSNGIKKPEPEEDSGWKSVFNYDPRNWDDAPRIQFPVPDVLKCEICWGRHYESCCPYLMEFPPNGVLRNWDEFFLVCDCNSEIAADRRCPNPQCYPGRSQRVVCKESITSPSYSP